MSQCLFQTSMWSLHEDGWFWSRKLMSFFCLPFSFLPSFANKMCETSKKENSTSIHCFKAPRKWNVTIFVWIDFHSFGIIAFYTLQCAYMCVFLHPPSWIIQRNCNCIHCKIIACVHVQKLVYSASLFKNDIFSIDIEHIFASKFWLFPNI